MAGKAAPKAARALELVSVRMGNAHATSAGSTLPGGVVELPPDEASALIAAGYAVRVAS